MMAMVWFNPSACAPPKVIELDPYCPRPYAPRTCDGVRPIGVVESGETDPFVVVARNGNGEKCVLASSVICALLIAVALSITRDSSISVIVRLPRERRPDLTIERNP